MARPTLTDEELVVLIDNLAEQSLGDIFNRNFTGDVAQCGCRWTREPGFGDVLRLCTIHQQASDANYSKFERARATKPQDPHDDE